MWSKSLLMKSFMTSINQLRTVCGKHTLHCTKNEIFDWSFVHAEVGYHEISTSIITDQISFPIKVTWQVDNVVNQLNFFKWYSLTKLSENWKYEKGWFLARENSSLTYNGHYKYRRMRISPQASNLGMPQDY